MKPSLAQFLDKFGPHLALLVAILLTMLAITCNGSEAVDDLKRIQKELTDKAESLKTADLVSYSLYMNAVKDLKKYTEDGDADGSRLLVTLLTPKNLHKLFKAPVQVDKKTGDVAIAYDFANTPAVIQDFEIGTTAPELRKGALWVPIAQALTHKAAFIGKVHIVGKIMQGNRMGDQFGMTNGLRLAGGSYNNWSINLTMPGSARASGTYSPDYGHSADPDFLAFSVDVNPQAIAVTWGEGVTGVQSPAPFLGSVMLMGGSGGNLYKDVIISGTLDQNWIKQKLGVGAQ
jgi:hypothetical protein